jgi:L-alanine-DL-glutamate epimerase-like enolase superfamily enzyme
MFKIKKINYYGLSIPFKKKVETNWSKRIGTTVFVLEVISENNTVGYGEIISMFDHKIVAKSLERMIKQIEKTPFQEITKLYQRAVYDSGWMRTGRLNDLGASCWAGIETAIYSCYSKVLKIPLLDFFGGSLKNEFSLAVNLDTGEISNMKKQYNLFKKKGYKNLFVKVAKTNNSLNQDLNMLSKIKSFSKNSGLCIDANGAWTIQTSLKALTEFKRLKLNLKCIEQPVMEGKFLKRLKDQSSFPIGINEILNSGQSIVDCANNNVGDIFVLDIFECGGLRNLLYICKFLELSGYQVMCRAHGSPSISYLTSLGIISCTNSNSITTPIQIYDFDDTSNYLKWKPTISNGIMKISNEDLNFELDEINFKKFLKIYRTGKKYHIYSNKKKDSIPFFPKY